MKNEKWSCEYHSLIGYATHYLHVFCCVLINKLVAYLTSCIFEVFEFERFRLKLWTTDGIMLKQLDFFYGRKFDHVWELLC